MAEYRVKVYVYPYSVEGPEKDEKAIGSRQQSINVVAPHFGAAVGHANTFLAGVRTNPRVWQAEIRSIEWVSD